MNNLSQFMATHSMAIKLFSYYVSSCRPTRFGVELQL